MSENLRDLVVSLSLRSDDFDKNIKLIGKQIKEAESEFRLASAGVENFENSLAGFRAKAELIRKQLDAQNKAVDQYTRKLQAAQKRLEDESGRHAVIGEKLNKERAERDRLIKVVEEQRQKVVGLSKAYGTDNDMVSAASELLVHYENQLNDCNAEIKKHEGQLVAVDRQLNKTGSVIADTSADLKNAQARVKELNFELAKNENAWYTHGVAMQSFAAKAGTPAEALDRVGGRLTTTVTAPLLALGGAAVKASIDYEDAFASVRKTVEVTGEDADAFFEKLSDSVVDMSTRFATSASDIAEVMAISGQLGIENEQLEDFTETIIRLGMSTNMAGEEAASELARFANITGMQQTEFNNMGATLVELGNKFATTEAEIMSMAMRIAAAGTQVGMEESEILGFAAALSSLGLEAEAGGSAFSKAIKQIEVAVETGSDRLNDFAKISGMTRDEFAKIWEANPAEAFQAFIVGLGQLDEEGLSAIAVLEEIGITELRLTDTLLRSANASEILAKTQETANREWINGEALINESEKRLETTASKLKNIKNSLIETGMQFADAMAPELQNVVAELKNVVEWISNLDDNTKRNIVNLAAWAAATGPVISAVGKTGKTVSSVVGTIGGMSKAVGKAKEAFKTTGSAVKAFSALLGPGGMVVAGVAAGAAAIYGLIKLSEYFERQRPNFSLNAEEIESYKIDVDELQTTVTVNANAEIAGNITELGATIIDVLNDGMPETEEVREGLKDKADAAVGAVYDLIEESYKSKKTELDDLFASGVIDQETYDTALADLEADATAMETDLKTKGDALTAYVTTLCDNNRAMTQEEIDTLNQLIAALGLTAEQVQNATNAQVEAYRFSYDKTRLGFGTEEDQRRAAEYIELLAAQRKAEIESQIAALNTLYADKTEGMTDEERAAEYAKLGETLKALQTQMEEIDRMRKEAHGGLVGNVLEQYGFSQEEIQAAADALVKFNEAGVEYNGILRNGPKATGSNFAGVGGDVQLTMHDLMDDEATLNAFVEKLQSSGLLDGNTSVTSIIATLIGDGVLPEGAMENNTEALETVTDLVVGADEAKTAMAALEGGTYSNASGVMDNAAQGVMDNKDQFVDAMETATGEAKQAATESISADDMSPVGRDSMMGMVDGILSAKGSVISAAVGVARAMLAAVKTEMGIHSPSRVFRDEVGAMAMKGFGLGFEDEAARQAKAIRNASRYLTGEAQAGAIAGTTDNRRTYNNETSVTVHVDSLAVNDRQDVQALATEIAALTSRQQRGRGARYA